jgi:hypothetical protein
MIRKLLGRLLYEIASVICTVAERVSPVYTGPLDGADYYGDQQEQIRAGIQADIDQFDPAKFLGEDPAAYLARKRAEIERMAAETAMPPQVLNDGRTPMNPGWMTTDRNHLRLLPGEDEHGEPNDPA